jgi:transposase
MITCEARERARQIEEAKKGNGQHGLDKKALADLVLEAVRNVGGDELNPPTPTESAPALQPRALLAILIYCYANRVYGSYDIEQMMHEDTAFRALCGREYPDGRQLRRFRRHNHAVLKRTLEEALRGAWKQGPIGNGDAKLSSNGLTDPAAHDWITQEAESRIEQAMFIDQMTMEN